MKRLAFGFVAFWPLAMIIAALIVMFATGFEPPPYWFIPVWIIATIAFATGWLCYFWDVWHNPRVPPEKRQLWTVVIFIACPYALPFYFWFYVR
jgi:MFS superfamily sulfate permease-like transporter